MRNYHECILYAEYAEYAAMAPPGKLELVLDQENGGVDLHLSQIQERLDTYLMVNRLCPTLGFSAAEIQDISLARGHVPAQMRYGEKYVHIAIVCAWW